MTSESKIWILPESGKGSFGCAACAAAPRQRFAPVRSPHHQNKSPIIGPSGHLGSRQRTGPGPFARSLALLYKISKYRVAPFCFGRPLICGGLQVCYCMTRDYETASKNREIKNTHSHFSNSPSEPTHHTPTRTYDTQNPTAARARNYIKPHGGTRTQQYKKHGGTRTQRK